MKLTPQIFNRDINLKDDGEFQVCDIPELDLVSLYNLDNLVVEATLIGGLDARQNHLKEIEPVMHKFKQLQLLDLSFNHISIIQNIQYLQQLRILNLSTNRLQKIDNLHYLMRLQKLNLSDNYIDEIDDLKLEQLEDLDISGNSLKVLFNFKHIHRKLRKLNFAKNQITHLNYFSEKEFMSLVEIDGSNNMIPLTETENLTIVLKNIPQLEVLDLLGNDIVNDKFYKYSVLSERRLVKLDGITIFKHNYEQIMRAGKSEAFDKAIKQTNADYIERMNHENQLRIGAKNLLKKQMEQVDELFDKFQDMTLTEQAKFTTYIKLVENKRRIGNVLELDEQQLLDWRMHIKKNIEEERLKFQQQQIQQNDRKDKYLNSKITAGTLREKLYDIAMNDPNLWKELKSKELKQIVREQQMYEEEKIDLTTVNQTQNNNTNNQGRQYDQMQNGIQEYIGQKIQDKLKLLDDMSDHQHMNRTNESGFKDGFDAKSNNGYNNNPFNQTNLSRSNASRSNASRSQY